MNRRYLTSTLQITWKRVTLWHHHLAMVHQRSQSRKKMAHSKSYTITGSLTNIWSLMLPCCQKYHLSSKNFEGNHCSANLISGQGTTTSVFWRRTHTRQASKLTKG